MNREETEADGLLLEAKERIKIAFRLIEPVPTEPVGTALLRVLDWIDRARKNLKDRGKL